jgi:uncharacterized protein YjbJ (UPF0337 family)
MPDSSGRQDNSEGAMDKAANRLKEAAGSLTGDKKDEGHADVRAEGRDDRFRELEEAYKGYAVYDRNYEKIGKVDDLFVDEDDHPEYIGVKMGFLLEQKTTLVPMGIVRINDRRKLVEVAADKDVIREAPAFDTNKDITPEYEDRVHGYFGLERPSSSPERSGYVDYYTSGSFTEEHYADQALAGVDTEYGERAESEDRPSVGTEDRMHGDLEQPPPGREETAEPRSSDVAGTGEAARTGGTSRRGAQEQETASVRVYKRVR